MFVILYLLKSFGTVLRVSDVAASKDDETIIFPCKMGDE